MAAETVPYGRVTQKPSAVAEVHILWITAGLGCDGDSVSITAATQPSIEDVLLGAIPGLPKVHLHNPVLAYEVGDDFLKYLYQAEEGQARSVRAGGGRLDSQREDQEAKATGRRWAPIPNTGQPITTNEWIDRLAPKALAVVALRNLRHLRRHSRHGRQSDRVHGAGGLSGMGLDVEGRPADRQCSRMPGAARQLHGDACSTCSIRWRAWRP